MRNQKEIVIDLDGGKKTIVKIKEAKIGRIYKVAKKLFKSSEENKKENLTKEQLKALAKKENEILFSTLREIFKNSISINEDDIEEFYGSDFAKIYDAFKEVNADFLSRLNSLKKMIPPTMFQAGKILIDQAFSESFLSR